MGQEIYPFYRFQLADGRLTPPWRLYLPIRLINPSTGKSAVAYGLVDTGADGSLFPGDLATFLGHNLKGQGVRSSVTCGIGEVRMKTFRNTFTVELLSADGKTSGARISLFTYRLPRGS